MTIDELASLTKIQEVAEQQGLSYNNNNIKTVDDNEQQEVIRFEKKEEK